MLSSPGPDITFAPAIATAASAVERLEAQGADLIVALTHQDFSDDRELARTVAGIDLILGGHDHNPITFAERDTLIVKAGYDAHYLAAIDLAVDRIEEATVRWSRSCRSPGATSRPPGWHPTPRSSRWWRA